MLTDVLRSYRSTLETDRRHLLEEFRFVEAARKVVGVGSVGTRAWVALMLAGTTRDPFFLQVKEAEESVLERFAGKSAFANHGQRVVAGQRLMQATSDIFLGWNRVNGLDGRRARLLLPPVPGLEGLGRCRLLAATGAWRSRAAVRLDARPRPRALGRPGRDRFLPGQVGRIRPGHRRVLDRLRRPEPHRLRGTEGGRGAREHQGRDGSLAAPPTGGRTPHRKPM